MEYGVLDDRVHDILDNIATDTTASLLAVQKQLKKKPGDPVLKTVKAYALAHTKGNPDQIKLAHGLLDGVLAANPSDDALLCLAADTLRALGRESEIPGIYERAFAAAPHDLALGRFAFVQLVRAAPPVDWKRAQHAATRLYRASREERHCWWSMCAAVMQTQDPATPPATRRVLLQLVLRLVDCVPTASWHRPQRFLLHVDVLGRLGRARAALNLLENRPEGKLLLAHNPTAQDMRRRLALQAGDWARQRDRARAFISEGNAPWTSYETYITCALNDAIPPPPNSDDISPWSTPDSSRAPTPELDVRRERLLKAAREVVGVLLGVMKGEERAHCEHPDAERAVGAHIAPEREPLLALLTLEVRVRGYGFGGGMSCVDLVDTLQRYIAAFAGHSACAEDVRPFVGALRAGERVRLRAWVELLPCDVKTRDALRRTINTFAIQRALEDPPPLLGGRRADSPAVRQDKVGALELVDKERPDARDAPSAAHADDADVRTRQQQAVDDALTHALAYARMWRYAVRAHAGEGEDGSVPASSPAVSSAASPWIGSSAASPTIGDVLRSPSLTSSASGERLASSDSGGKLSSAGSDGSLRVPVSESGGSMRLTKSESGGSLRVPASESAGSLRLTKSESGGSLRVPAFDSAGSLRLTKSESGGSQRLATFDSTGSLRVPASQSGGTQQLATSDSYDTQQLAASDSGDNHQLATLENGQQLAASVSYGTEQRAPFESGGGEQLAAADSGQQLAAADSRQQQAASDRDGRLVASDSGGRLAASANTQRLPQPQSDDNQRIPELSVPPSIVHRADDDQPVRRAPSPHLLRLRRATLEDAPDADGGAWCRTLGSRPHSPGELLEDVRERPSSRVAASPGADRDAGVDGAGTRADEGASAADEDYVALRETDGDGGFTVLGGADADAGTSVLRISEVPRVYVEETDDEDGAELCRPARSAPRTPGVLLEEASPPEVRVSRERADVGREDGDDGRTRPAAVENEDARVRGAALEKTLRARLEAMNREIGLHEEALGVTKTGDGPAKKMQSKTEDKMKEPMPSFFARKEPSVIIPDDTAGKSAVPQLEPMPSFFARRQDAVIWPAAQERVVSTAHDPVTEDSAVDAATLDGHGDSADREHVELVDERGELHPADDLAILSAQAFVGAWKMSGDPAYLLPAVCILEAAARHSPHSYAVRLPLVRVYRLLGCGAGLALDHYNKIKIGGAEAPTMGHWVLERAGAFAYGAAPDSSPEGNVGRRLVKMCKRADVDSSHMADVIVSLFLQENYESVSEMVTFRERLERSLQGDLVTIERMRIALLGAVKPTMETIEGELKEMKRMLDYEAHDTRDFALLVNYQPVGGASFLEQTSLGGVCAPGAGWRNAFVKLYLRVFAASEDPTLVDRVANATEDELAELTVHERGLVSFVDGVRTWLTAGTREEEAEAFVRSFESDVTRCTNMLKDGGILAGEILHVAALLHERYVFFNILTSSLGKKAKKKASVPIRAVRARLQEGIKRVAAGMKECAATQTAELYVPHCVHIQDIVPIGAVLGKLAKDRAVAFNGLAGALSRACE